MARADASASRPPAPAPWATVAAVPKPLRRSKRATFAAVSRTRSAESSAALPSPATTTRPAGSLPKVWTTVISPRRPRISPSAISCAIAPSRARSAAPVAPSGLVTPSNRLTTIALPRYSRMSPCSARISTAVSFATLVPVFTKHSERGAGAANAAGAGAALTLTPIPTPSPGIRLPVSGEGVRRSGVGRSGGAELAGYGRGALARPWNGHPQLPATVAPAGASQRAAPARRLIGRGDRPAGTMERGVRPYSAWVRGAGGESDHRWPLRSDVRAPLHGYSVPRPAQRPFGAVLATLTRPPRFIVSSADDGTRMIVPLPAFITS